MSKTKSGGSTRNGRDSAAKRLGPKAFDGRGNYTLGIKEHIIFPEINYDKIDKIRGMNITIVTTAKTDEEAKALLGEGELDGLGYVQGGDAQVPSPVPVEAPPAVVLEEVTKG